MAKTTKITIRVNPARRSETISWSGAGSFGSLNLAQTSGQLNNEPLTSAATPNAYWAAVLALVVAQL